MTDQVKIRLMGLPEDVNKMAAALHGLLLVLEESPDCPNRNSSFVRRYLVARPEPPDDESELEDGVFADLEVMRLDDERFPELLQKTWDIDEHPYWYGGPCMCGLCRSYGD